MVVASDEVQDDEDDEAVRCICGSEDYPGQPPVDGPDADFFAGIEFTEDVTGFFVQCDICKVWQHGACVGIFSAESSPDEYFCEQCRKDLHKVLTASNGYVFIISFTSIGARVGARLLYLDQLLARRTSRQITPTATVGSRD